MSASLKLVISDSGSSAILVALCSDDLHSKINALAMVDSNSINDLLDQVKICAYDYRPAVRVHAYKALKYAKPSKITSVIKDAIRDEDKAAFKIARELFHQTNA